MCGSCLKYGRNRFFSSAALRAANLFATRRFLGDHGVRRYVSACFVNPNARCPVCGVQVFYYEIAHGSRVYFDDLGPPWPKHPCTDSDRFRSPSPSLCIDPPQRRKRGIKLELVEAWQKIAASEPEGGAEDDEEAGWVLL